MKNVCKKFAVSAYYIRYACHTNKIYLGYKWKYKTPNIKINYDTKKWKILSMFPKYKISCRGEIYSIKFNIILKNTKCGKYYRVSVNDNNGARKMMLVHRLVAMAYVPNPNNYKIVNHINNVSTDNKSINLEWTTHQKNMIHQIQYLFYFIQHGVAIRKYLCQFGKNLKKK